MHSIPLMKAIPFVLQIPMVRGEESLGRQGTPCNLRIPLMKAIPFVLQIPMVRGEESLGRQGTPCNFKGQLPLQVVAQR